MLKKRPGLHPALRVFVWVSWLIQQRLEAVNHLHCVVSELCHRQHLLEKRAKRRVRPTCRQAGHAAYKNDQNAV
jgi:hypothetical protein